MKTIIWISNLSDYCEAYILVKETAITRAGVDATARLADDRNKHVRFKNCVSFTDCKSEMNKQKISQKISSDTIA